MTKKEKCQKIKALVEALSGCENIGIRSRLQPIPDLKKIYSKLCRLFTRSSFATIGDALGNYDHGTILSAIKSFNSLYSVNQLQYIEVFSTVFDKLEKQENISRRNSLRTDSIRIQLNKKSIRQELMIEHLKITEKFRSIINKQLEEIESLKSQLKI